ncbi:SGNH/GDSL hydrolase family protein [Xanthobacter flavus]|uniref:SGNH/GDSL hydrolase family protein n=1 Tax=Xanthobacter flavus TaxID=281 RepID=UPI0037265E4F
MAEAESVALAAVEVARALLDEAAPLVEEVASARAAVTAATDGVQANATLAATARDQALAARNEIVPLTEDVAASRDLVTAKASETQAARDEAVAARDEVAPMAADVDTKHDAVVDAASQVETNVTAAAHSAEVASAAAAAAAVAATTISAGSWVALVAITPAFVGQRAQVSVNDAGTHSGRTAASPDSDTAGVANSGVYGAFALTVGAWRRDGALPPTAIASDAQAIAGTASDLAMTPASDAAALKARFGNMKTQAIAADYGYLSAWVDKIGRFLGGFKTSGRLVVKLDDTAYVPTAALDAGAQARLIPSGTTGAQVLARINPAAVAWRQFDPITGFIYGITDAKGRIVLGITPEGHLRARIANGSTVPVAALDPAMVARINPAGITWKTMAPDTGYIFAAVDAKNRVLFGVTAEGLFKTKLAPGVGVTEDALQPLVASALDTALAELHLFPSTSRIVCWGDSMTAGAGGSGTTYPGVLASLLPGKTVSNLGIGGQTSTQIAARQGGVPIKVTVDGNSIPASGGVAVTAKSVNILYNSSNYVGTSTGKLAGTAGTMSTDTAGNWMFTRAASGSAVDCPPDTVFYPDTATTFESDTAIIWAGRNNAVANTVRNDVIAMVDRLKPLNKRVLVVSVCNGSGETSGTSAYRNIAAVNAELARYFGDQFVDVRRYLIDFGLAEAGITPTSQDTSDIAGDTIPVSLRYDGVHLLGPGYTVEANLLNRVLRAKGWV